MKELTDDKDTLNDLRAVLYAIVEGYDVKSERDRFIIVDNPKGNAEGVALRGEDPYLVLDVWALYGHVDEDGDNL